MIDIIATVLVINVFLTIINLVNYFNIKRDYEYLDNYVNKESERVDKMSGTLKDNDKSIKETNDNLFLLTKHLGLKFKDKDKFNVKVVKRRIR